MGLGERMQDLSVTVLSAEETEAALERDRHRKEAVELRRAIVQGEREDAEERHDDKAPLPGRE